VPLGPRYAARGPEESPAGAGSRSSRRHLIIYYNTIILICCAGRAAHLRKGGSGRTAAAFPALDLHSKATVMVGTGHPGEGTCRAGPED
jgi:hypothetical protein